MDKGVKGSQRGRASSGEIEDFLPKSNRFERKETDLLKFFLREGTVELTLKKADVIFHLILDVLQRMVLDFIVNKRGVEEEEGDLEGASLNFIPFDHRPTDVVATYQKIGFGKFSQRAFAGQGGPNVRKGIRA
jgi:hypothetical protein